jgi:MYXO-CTERM domain-containing protein
MNRRPHTTQTNHNLALLAAALLLVHGCGTGVVLDDVRDDSLGERESFIVNGQPDSGHPAVGLLKMTKNGGQGLCTATLIGARTVLTAAHCVYGMSSVTFTVGGTTYQAASATYHESYSPSVLTANDVAVVKLTQQVNNVQPLPLAKVAPSVGEPVTIVGFGVTGSGLKDSGIKRVTQNTVSSVTTQYFRYAGSSGGAGNTCQGDSGGPTLRVQGGETVVLGVHSTASVPCGYAGNDMRVDHFRAWIKLQAAGDLVSDDKQAPAVSIDSPVAGSTLGGGFSVKVTASDSGSGLASIKLFIDGKLLASKSASPATFSVAELSDGKHNLRADAQDKAGNVGATLVSVTVKTSTGAPPATGPGTTPPAPPSSGSFGATCSSPDDCGSRLCASDAYTGTSYCTQVCNDSGVCPGGADCIPAGGTYVCAVTDTGSTSAAAPEGELLLGSCSVGQGGGLGLWPLALALLALLCYVRRRR